MEGGSSLFGFDEKKFGALEDPRPVVTQKEALGVELVETLNPPGDAPPCLDIFHCQAAPGSQVTFSSIINYHLPVSAPCH